jgi:TetR/AcrR family transcriptional repressor of bet genes
VSCITPTEVPIAIDRRAELAQAAYELIAERGLSGLSLRALARRVGATTGLVSHHFLDRAELVAAALDHARLAMFNRIVGLHPGSDPIDAVASILPIDDDVATSWRVWLSVRAAALSDRELHDFHHQMYAEYEEFLRRRLGPFLEGGPHDPTWCLDHLMAVIDGVALRATLERAAWPAERQRAHLVAAIATVSTPDGEART